MALCGSQNCGCAFASSATIAVTGSGTAADPYEFSGTASPTATIEVFTASGTWTKPAGLAYVEVEVQGAGGGSGGCATTIANEASVGAGGGGGGYARMIIAASALAATEAVSVGSGGSAGAAGSGDGGDGGSSSFGTHCAATGGAGGPGGTAAASSSLFFASPASGGQGAAGDVMIAGSRSQHAIVNSTGTRVKVGEPGASMLSTGKRVISALLTSSAGVDGSGYGGGALGAYNVASSGTARAGAIGGAGVVIVREYF